MRLGLGIDYGLFIVTRFHVPTTRPGRPASGGTRHNGPVRRDQGLTTISTPAATANLPANPRVNRKAVKLSGWRDRCRGRSVGL